MAMDIFEYLNEKKKPWKFLAPMVGNSDYSYRKFASNYGADLCYTEMVQCHAFNKVKGINIADNWWFSTDGLDRPLIIQIAGHDADVMLETCKRIEHLCDAIDINFGCPQEIAKKGHYGAYLMDDFVLCEKIVRKISSNIKIPLFCKIRVFESKDKTLEFAMMLEKNGCKLLVVHGRTREQKGINSGLASWEHIKYIKENLNIKVIANGNMIYRNDIDRCWRETKCDGVMIAEPHLYNPMIFSDKTMSSIKCFEKYLETVKTVKFKNKVKYIKSHGFKIMHGLITQMPELSEELGKCNNLESYNNFINKVKNMNLKDNLLEMKPYIRVQINK